MVAAASAQSGRLRGPAERFERSIAVVLGVDAYDAPLPPLRSAVADARAVAGALAADHGFDVRAFFDAEVHLAGVRDLLERGLPAEIGPRDRLIVYFAGHGIALDGDDGPAGYLLLHDARRDQASTFLPMRLLHDRLAELPCRHALIILDCCFAGSFRWSSLRHATSHRMTRIYRERYERFVESAAWQVLTSSASDQPAMDRLSPDRGEGSSGHSPFASALLRALRGAADFTGDGLVTASELGLYARDQVERLVEGIQRRQTPQLFQLNRHQRGEFVFQVPGRELDLPPAPTLTPDRNPYRGLQSYEEGDAGLFFGRAAAAQRLAAAVFAQPLTVVIGPSGSGKSSLVKAGLLPALRAAGGWRIARPQRPGHAPMTALRALADELAAGQVASAGAALEPAAAWLAAVEATCAGPETRTLVVIDQLEELLTHRGATAARPAFLAALAEALPRCPGLRLVATLRSDVEPQLQSGPLAPWWSAGRFPIPPMTRAEMREAIERPATENVLYFEPDSLVDRLIDDVALLSAPLPLLSFALSELFRLYWERGADDRALRASDYEALGSVARALTLRATSLHDELAAESRPHALTVRNLMLRMTTTVGGEVARRRVAQAELVYPEEAENRRVEDVLERFQAARLVVRGSEKGSDGTTDVAYAEPAHDELVRGWDKVTDWLDAAAATRPLVQGIGEGVRGWLAGACSPARLWHSDPRLDQAVELAERPEPLLNRDEAAFVRASQRRRRRGHIALAGSVAAVLLLLTSAAVVALIARQRAEESAAEARHRLGLTYQEEGRQLTVEGDVVRALPYLLAAREEGIDTPALRVLFGQARRRLWLVSLRHDGPVYAASFRPDGARILTASEDGTARIWDAVTGAPAAPPLRHAGPVGAAVWSRDGARVATASDDGTARIWDATTGAPTTPPLAHQRGRVLGVAFSPDGGRVVTWDDRAIARIWSTATGEWIGQDLRGSGSTTPFDSRPRFVDQVPAAVFSPDGSRVAQAASGDKARIWDGATGAHLVDTAEDPESLSTLAFSPDGALLATGSDGGNLRVWDARTGEAVTPPLRNLSDVNALAFSPDGLRLMAVAEHAFIWDTLLWRLIMILDLPQPAVARAAAWSADSSRVAVAGNDGTLRVFIGQDPLSDVLRHDDEIFAVDLSPDGQRVVTASADHTARVWSATAGAPLGLPRKHVFASQAFSPDGAREVLVERKAGASSVQIADAPTGKLLAPRREVAASLNAIAFSPDSQRVALYLDDPNAPPGPVQIWDAARAEPVAQLRGPAERLALLQFSPDGARIVTASRDRTARVWDAATGQVLHGPFEHDVSAGAPQLRGGTRLLTVAADRTARVWDATTGRPISPALGQKLSLAVFDAGGSRVLTASADGSARIWDATSGQALSPPLRHRSAVRAAAFSLDGGRVVTGSDDHTAGIWDAATGALLVPLLQHDNTVDSAAFSPDGALLVTITKARHAQVWDAATGRPLTRSFASGLGFHGAAFTPDGARVLTQGDMDETLLWDMSPDGGSLAEWQALVASCIPYAVAGGILVPRAGALSTCRISTPGR